MIIAARSSFIEHKNIPYVADGLIAWWDGIWNAGIGVHDANATEWKDLIGGRSFLLPNGFYIIGENQISLKRSPDTSVITCDIGEPHLNEFTLEAWADHGVPKEYRPEIYYSNFGVAYDYPTSGGTYTLIANDGNYYSSGVIKSGALSVICPSKYLYYNGKFFSTTKKWNGTRPSSNEMHLGISGNRYSIFRFLRLYSRALTAEEIANNYAVDKARFGLP